MEKIRHGMFETNSSSTHSLIIASQEEYKNWENGKAIMDLFNEKMINLSNNKEIKKIENGYIYHDKYYANIEDIYDEVHPGKYLSESKSNRADMVTKEIGDKVAISVYMGDDS